MYGPVFETMFGGSMYGCGLARFVVLTYAIAGCDKNGIIELNPKRLADTFGCEEDDVTDAIEFLCSPDEDSRSEAEEGRRLVHEGAFSYRLVNKAKYRDMMKSLNKAEYNKGFMAGMRAAEKGSGPPPEPEKAAPPPEEKKKRSVQTITEKVVEMWNDKGITPGVRGLSDQRKSAISARARQHGSKAVFEVVEKRAASDFLQNVFNDGKGAPFDWCMGPKNFVKILDGNYDAVEGKDGAGEFSEYDKNLNR